MLVFVHIATFQGYERSPKITVSLLIVVLGCSDVLAANQSNIGEFLSREALKEHLKVSTIYEEGTVG